MLSIARTTNDFKMNILICLQFESHWSPCVTHVFHLLLYYCMKLPFIKSNYYLNKTTIYNLILNSVSRTLKLFFVYFISMYRPLAAYIQSSFIDRHCALLCLLTVGIFLQSTCVLAIYHVKFSYYILNLQCHIISLRCLINVNYIVLGLCENAVS